MVGWPCMRHFLISAQKVDDIFTLEFLISAQKFGNISTVDSIISGQKSCPSFQSKRPEQRSSFSFCLHGDSPLLLKYLPFFHQSCENFLPQMSILLQLLGGKPPFMKEMKMGGKILARKLSLQVSLLAHQFWAHLAIKLLYHLAINKKGMPIGTADMSRFVQGEPVRPFFFYSYFTLRGWCPRPSLGSETPGFPYLFRLYECKQPVTRAPHQFLLCTVHGLIMDLFFAITCLFISAFHRLSKSGLIWIHTSFQHFVVGVWDL